MNPVDPAYHTQPLVQMVASKLHPSTTLADRVRKLRYKRRKPKVQLVEPVKECGDAACVDPGCQWAEGGAP